MNQLDIRHAFEDKARELGGKVLGSGCLMVSPFTMDFNFALEGKEYSVSLVNMEEKRRAIADGMKSGAEATIESGIEERSKQTEAPA
jgi:hypothetical protein